MIPLSDLRTKFSRKFADRVRLQQRKLASRIDELTLENDFLEGALSKAGLLSARR